MTKLTILKVNSGVIHSLRPMFAQLKKIKCDFDVLIQPKLPVLNLDKLTILNCPSRGSHNLKKFLNLIYIFSWYIVYLSPQHQSAKFSRGRPFQCSHIVSTLNHLFTLLSFSKSNVHQGSVERLILHAESVWEMSTSLRIIIQFCENLPKLKKLDLKINEFFYVSHSKMLSKHLYF